MTKEQIEAKAFELYPVKNQWFDGPGNPPRDRNKISRDIFINYVRSLFPAADGGREADRNRDKRNDQSAVVLIQREIERYCNSDKTVNVKTMERLLDFINRLPAATEEPSIGGKILDTIREAMQPAPVDPVALLEWVGESKKGHSWKYYPKEGKWFNLLAKGPDINTGLTTAALIQEFINQKTKEV